MVDRSSDLSLDEFDAQLITDWLETFNLIDGRNVPTVPTSAREGELKWAHDNVEAWRLVSPNVLSGYGLTRTEAHTLMVKFIDLAYVDQTLREARYNKAHDKVGRFATKSGYKPGRDVTEKVGDLTRDGHAENGLVTQKEADFSDPRSHQLMAIAKVQGFDGKPTMGSVDDAVANGALEVHRGLVPFGGSKTVKAKTAEQMRDDFLGGAYESGTGNHGNGFYFTTSAGIAKMYSGASVSKAGYGAKAVSGGVTFRAALRKDAKVVSYKDIQAEQREWYAANKDRIYWDGYKTDFQIPKGKLSPTVGDSSMDPGLFAAMKGYDAIRVPLADRPSDRRNAAKIRKKIGDTDLGDEIIVINRTALIVEGAP